MQKLKILMQGTKTVKGEIFFNSFGIKCFYTEDNGRFKISEFKSGKFIGEGETADLAKQKSNSILSEKGITSQKAMDEYIEKCNLSVIN